MTPLELALTSPDKMDWYFDSTPASRIISDIVDFAKYNADRTVIATACLQGLIATNANNGMASAYGPTTEQADIAVDYADALIERLKK